MNAKSAIAILLALVSIGLGVGWYSQRQKAARETEAYEAKLKNLSEDLRKTHQTWVEQTKVNSALENNLSNHVTEISTLSNKVIELTNTIVKVETQAKANADAAAAAIASAEEEIKKQTSRITELEGEKDQLTKRMTELNGEITTLEKQIGDTERKLAVSEGDREFLLKELKRLQAEKAELERQFNDLAVLREQVRKLKEELSIARRIEWIRRGLYGANANQKGGERLQKGAAAIPAPKTNVSLNAEIRRDGTPATIVTPTLPGNQPPAATPTPAPAPAPAPGPKPTPLPPAPAPKP